MKLSTRMNRMSLSKRNAVAGYLLVSPIFVGIILFTILPVFFSLFISFTDWNMLHDYNWIGFKNYSDVLSSRMLRTVSTNTLIYCVIAIPGSIICGLLLALAMNSRIKGIPFYRSAFFLPNITTTVAVAIVWTWLYNDNYGLINNVLNVLGIPSVKWISSRAWAMPSVAIMSIWQAMGYDMIILTAGLKNIDPTYYEAADIDGANGFQSFRKITIPLLSPTLFFLLVTHFIGYMQMFDAAYIMTKGGPGHATRTIVMQIYYTAFEFFRMGEAASYAWLLFIVVMVVTMIQFKLQNKWVNYDV